MTSKNDLLSRCISVHRVPKSIQKYVLQRELKNQHNLNIVNIEEIPVAEDNTELRRWILELEDEQYTKHLQYAATEVNFDEEYVSVELKKSTANELPTNWITQNMQTNSTLAENLSGKDQNLSHGKTTSILDTKSTVASIHGQEITTVVNTIEQKCESQKSFGRGEQEIENSIERSRASHVPTAHQPTKSSATGHFQEDEDFVQPSRDQGHLDQSTLTHLIEQPIQPSSLDHTKFDYCPELMSQDYNKDKQHISPEHELIGQDNSNLPLGQTLIYDRDWKQTDSDHDPMHFGYLHSSQEQGPIHTLQSHSSHEQFFKKDENSPNSKLITKEYEQISRGYVQRGPLHLQMDQNQMSHANKHLSSASGETFYQQKEFDYLNSMRGQEVLAQEPEHLTTTRVLEYKDTVSAPYTHTGQSFEHVNRGAYTSQGHMDQIYRSDHRQRQLSQGQQQYSKQMSQEHGPMRQRYEYTNEEPYRSSNIVHDQSTRPIQGYGLPATYQQPPYQQIRPQLTHEQINYQGNAGYHYSNQQHHFKSGYGEQNENNDSPSVAFIEENRPPHQNQTLTKLKLRNLPNGLDEEDIKMFLENKKTGSLSVASVHLNEATRTAEVEMDNFQDAYTLHQRGSIQIKGMAVVVELFNSTSSTLGYKAPDDTPCIIVTGLPKSIEEEDIRMYFENTRKFPDIEVVDVQHNRDTMSAVISFSSQIDVDTVLTKGPLKIMGNQVILQRYRTIEDHRQSTNYDLKTSKEPVFDGTQTAILVEDIPINVDAEMLDLWFTSKQLGSCTIKNIDLNERDRYAVITFASPNDVRTVLDNLPIKIKNKEVSVRIYIPKKHNKTPEETPCIIVTGLPESIDEEDIRMYFENTRTFPDIEVVDVQHNRDTMSAVISFSSQIDVDTVLTKGPLKIMGNQVILQRYRTNEDHRQSTNDDLKTSKEPVFDGTQTAILVEDIPIDVDTEMLDMWFTSKQLGSCTIKNIDLDERDRNAVITFASPNDVRTVLDNRPIKIKNKEVSVQIYIPKKHNTIICRGPDEMMNTDHLDVFEMYFENEKKSGGGPTTKVEFRSIENAFYVTYEEENVAKRVAERSHRPLNKEIKVELFIPSRSTKDRTSWSEHKNIEKNMPGVGDRNNVESQKLKTVKVRGVNMVPSRESVQLYFESKKQAGGGDIEKRFTDDEDDDVMYIQFTDESVASDVAGRQHTLCGHKLDVCLHTPCPSYPNKMLIRGLNPKISFSVLELYLENKAGLSLVPDSLTYHVDHDDTALVTVDGTIDMPKLEESCKSKQLEGSVLRFSLVPISNCVLVSNISDAVSKDMVSLHFENEKRSNGGTVDHVDIITNQNICLVYFVDYTVVDKVLSKDQIFDGRKLEVKRYMSCIGRAEGDTTMRRFIKPEPCIVKSNKQKLMFLSRSVPTKNALEKLLAENHATMTWSSNEDVEDVELCSTLTGDVKNCVNLAKNWTTNAQHCFDDFMKSLEVQHVVVVEDIFETVIEHIGTLKQDNNVAICIQKEDNRIYVVGKGQIVSDIANDIERVVRETRKAFEKKMARTEVNISKLKPLETKLLLADNFVRTMEDKYEGVKVTINIGKNEISIAGENVMVNTIQIHMYEIKDTFKSTESNIQKETLDIYMSDHVRKYIDDKLIHNNIVAAWEINNHKLVVMSKSDEMLRRAVDIVCKSVKTDTIPLTQENRTLVQSNIWENMKSSLTKENEGKLKIEDNALDVIHVSCTDDFHTRMLQKITEFLDNNTTWAQTLVFPNIITTLFIKKYTPTLEYFAKKNNVLLTSSLQTKTITITGNKIGISCFEQELRSLAKKVHKKQHWFSTPGICDFMNSKQGLDLIDEAENAYPLLITLGEADDSYGDVRVNDMSSQAPILPQDCSCIASCTTNDMRKIYVIFGDLTDLKVDAIVNPSDCFLNLFGSLGKSIRNKGGDAFARECQLFIKEYTNLDDAAVFMSTAGNFSAHSIFHVACPTWKGGLQEEDTKLAEVVFKVLDTISKKGYTSVAMPAICCGEFGYPVIRATKVIAAAITNFFREVQESKLTEIYLCDINEDTINGFIKGLEMQCGASNIRRLNSKKRDSAHLQLPMTKPSMNTTLLQVKLGGISVELKKGYIADQNIQVIVSTSNKHLDLNSGAVSKTILKQAGPEMQNELKQKYPRGITYDQVAVTKGYELKCTHVIHGAVPKYTGKQDIDTLKQLVKLSMEEAQTLNRTSIALPSIGTGKLGYPKTDVATEMLSAISEFATQNPGSPIRNAQIILYPDDDKTIKAFEQEFISRAKPSRATRGRDYDHYENLTAEGGDEENLYERIPSRPSERDDSVIVIGKVRITIKQGDITAEDVDCIINSSNGSLDLTQGQVSKALVQICGDRLVKDATSKREEMKQNGIAITDAHNLKCNYIMHIVAKDSVKEWKGCVNMCLKKAKSEQYHSIAFPALGTERNMGAEVAATTMFQAIYEFASEGFGSLKDIRFVIFQSKMVDHFKKAAQDTASATSDDQKATLCSGNAHGICMEFYSLEESVIRNAIGLLQERIEAAEKITSYTDSVIARLDERQISAISKLDGKCNVEIKYTGNKIDVKGFLENVQMASGYIDKILRVAIQIEKDKQDASILTNIVQWFYIEVTQAGDKHEPFEENLNFKIEQAYQKLEGSFEYSEDSTKIVVDFNTLKEYVKGETVESNKSSILRKDLIKDKLDEIPKDWKEMKGNYLVYQLMTTEQTYTDVVTEFNKTVGSPCTVLKVEKVQNKNLWQQYAAKNKQLERENPPGTKNERFLWHGTSEDTCDSINAHGFNRSFCGKNAVAYGQGVYFAVNAKYSAGKQYSRPDQNGVKRMYYCGVLTGEYALGTIGMRVPPSKPTGVKEALFNSVTDNINNPTMFIIFNDTQAYPLYIVHFKIT